MRSRATTTYKRHWVVVGYRRRNSRSLGSPPRALPADFTTHSACGAPSRLSSQKLAYNFILSAERYSAGTAERSTSGRCCASASGMCAATQGYRTVKSEKCAAGHERN